MSIYAVVFLALHNVLRYLVFFTTITVVVQCLMGVFGKRQFTPANRRMTMFMMLSCDMQLLSGLAVYYFCGHLHTINKGAAFDSYYNEFYIIIHPLSMIVAQVLVHLAHKSSKKTEVSHLKFVKIFWLTLIALFLFLSQTPWPSKKTVGRPMLPIISTKR
jgi:hypothetical protein